MLYATKDAGAAIGEIITAIASTHTVDRIEIKLMQDSMTTTLHLTTGESITSPSQVIRKQPSRTVSTKKMSSSDLIACDGIKLTVDEWASKLGVSAHAIKYRMTKHGNPYGRRSPTDEDILLSGMSPSEPKDIKKDETSAEASFAIPSEEFFTELDLKGDEGKTESDK